jgi:hypothetical protein
MVNQGINRISWVEPSSDGRYFENLHIIAERINSEWRFYERYAFEIKWHEITSNPNLLEKLNQELENY